MANLILKKDGSKVPFDAEKIKSAVLAAATDAGLSEEEASRIASEVESVTAMSFEGQEEASTDDIREKILSELDVSAPAVSEAWRKYEEGKG